MALVITPDATLVVRAPFCFPDKHIEDFVSRHDAWIRRKLIEIAKYPRPLVKEYVEGESFLYLGESRRLRVVEGLDVPVLLDGELKISPGAPRKTKASLIHWYKERAREVLGSRAFHYSKLSGLTHRSIRLSNAARRWGSCGPSGSLNFNWRIVMAPLRVIDYLVVHELSHLAERNHSKRFWLKVEAILPDYRDSRRWLKENGHSLSC